MSLRESRVRLDMKVFQWTSYQQILAEDQNGHEKVWLSCLRIRVVERRLRV